MNLRMPLLMPMRLVACYIAFGVLVSFFGPVVYFGYEKSIIAVYMSFFILLFVVGYWIGVKSFKYKPLPEKVEYFNQLKTLKLVKIMIIIYTISQVLTLGLQIAGGTLNTSISEVGNAYINVYEDYERNTGDYSLTFLISTAAYIPYLVTTILGVYYFKKLPMAYKVMVIFAYISIILIQTIGLGKQKQFADLIFTLVLIKVISSSGQVKKVSRSVGTLFVYFLGGSVCLSGLLYMLGSRYEALGIYAGNINEKIHPLMQIDFDHGLFAILGEKIGLTIAQLSTYLSQGYYGLSLTMREPFEWTYFVGNSYSLTVFLNRFLGLPLDYRDTYPYRAATNTGWAETKWSSALSWYAGDFTFVGTLFFFGLMAFLYGRVWIESVRFKNPISILLFVSLSIGFLYLPANNQLMHTPGSVFALVVFLALWVLRGNLYNFYEDRVGLSPKRKRRSAIRL